MDRNKKFPLSIGIAAGIFHFIVFSLKKGILVGVMFGTIAAIIVGGFIAIVMKAMDVNKEQ